MVRGFSNVIDEQVTLPISAGCCMIQGRSRGTRGSALVADFSSGNAGLSPQETRSVARAVDRVKRDRLDGRRSTDFTQRRDVS
jgi:hypothetical protein